MFDSFYDLTLGFKLIGHTDTCLRNLVIEKILQIFDSSVRLVLCGVALPDSGHPGMFGGLDIMSNVVDEVTAKNKILKATLVKENQTPNPQARGNNFRGNDKALVRKGKVLTRTSL